MGLDLHEKTAIHCSENEKPPTSNPPQSVNSRAPLPIVDFGTRCVPKSKGVSFRPRGREILTLVELTETTRIRSLAIVNTGEIFKTFVPLNSFKRGLLYM